MGKDYSEELSARILSGGSISREEALRLYNESELPALAECADTIREALCGDGFDLCSIVNGKSGRCTEDCRFCAQSSRHHTDAEEYGLLSQDKIVAAAKRAEASGVLRFSIVTSGRRLSRQEVIAVGAAAKEIRETTKLAVCVSPGLLSASDFEILRDHGISRVHNNLETSRRFFPQICTSHTYDEKLATLRAAKSVGLSLCSGGIFGLGEEVEDRIDMAFELRALGVRSVPVNILNAIPGTPLALQKRLTSEDARRITAVYRFILPDASIRLAGGRGVLDDAGFGCFKSGANATITGDMLTTSGIDARHDLEVITGLGYRPALDGK